MTVVRRIAATAGAVAALTLGLALPAQAIEATDGLEFAGHVVECQQHFEGTHNPGVMHQGVANWSEHHMG